MMRNIRPAFTMIELVFIIVILGIVGVAGSKALYKVSENYILQRSFNQLELETHRVLDLMTRYLEHAVWETLHIPGHNGATISWISKDIDNHYGSFDGTSNTPRFSGVIKLEESKASTTVAGDIEITSSGSRLDLPRNAPSSSAQRLFLTQNHDLDSYIHKLQTIKTVHGANTFIITPQHTATPAKELYEITQMVEPELFSFVLHGKELKFRKSTASHTDYSVVDEVKELHFWLEGEGSILRMRLCMNNAQLSKLLECEHSHGEFCTIGFCKESAIVR